MAPLTNGPTSDTLTLLFSLVALLVSVVGLLITRSKARADNRLTNAQADAQLCNLADQYHLLRAKVLDLEEDRQRTDSALLYIVLRPAIRRTFWAELLHAVQIKLGIVPGLNARSIDWAKLESDLSRDISGNGNGGHG